jgi:hypothetical protein
MKTLFFGFYFLAISIASAQIVVIGPDGKISGPPSDLKGCAQVEKLQPNLTLKVATHVYGNLVDETSAPFENSPIELRTYISQSQQQVVKRISTDVKGNFDLGTIEPGKYRLLLSPSRGFAQPNKLVCSSKECVLHVIVKANLSDLIAGPCPIR